MTVNRGKTMKRRHLHAIFTEVVGWRRRRRAEHSRPTQADAVLKDNYHADMIHLAGLENVILNQLSRLAPPMIIDKTRTWLAAPDIYTTTCHELLNQHLDEREHQRLQNHLWRGR